MVCARPRLAGVLVSSEDEMVTAINNKERYIFLQSHLVLSGRQPGPSVSTQHAPAAVHLPATWLPLGPASTRHGCRRQSYCTELAGCRFAWHRACCLPSRHR